MSTATAAAGAGSRELTVIAVGDAFLSFAWAPSSRRPTTLCFQIKRAFAAGGGTVPWADAPRVALAASATQHEAAGLACQETYEARLCWQDAAGADAPWVVGAVATFDTLPAGCGPRKRKGCAVM